MKNEAKAIAIKERNERIAENACGWERGKVCFYGSKYGDVPYYEYDAPDGTHYDCVLDFVKDDSTMATLVEGLRKQVLIEIDTDQSLVTKQAMVRLGGTIWFVDLTVHAALIAATERWIKER